MKQLTINPKEKGTTIKFGKLPILTRSLTHWLDMDNVIQLKVEGRYYAIELRPTQPSPLELALEKIKEATEEGSLKITCEELEDDEENIEETEKNIPTEKKSSFKTHYQIGRDRFEKLKELEQTGELAECKNRLDICRKMGFRPVRRKGPGYNWLSNQIKKGYLEEELVKYNKQNSGEYRYHLTGEEPRYSGNKKIQEKTAEKKVEKLTNELEKLGFTNLSETHSENKIVDKKNPIQWLKPHDYVIYKLFLYGNGQVSMGKAVSFDEIKEVFADAPDVKMGGTQEAPGKFAGRIANIALVHLLREGVVEKAQPGVRNKDNIFSLTLVKGGQYARNVYKTVSIGSYKKEKNGNRELYA
jgi:hypothetical protein